jgi:hypothetical protein
MKKAVLCNTNAGRILAAIKDSKAIIFTDYDLDRLGIDAYGDSILWITDFDFDGIVDNNAPGSLDFVDATTITDNPDVEVLFTHEF